MARKKTLALKMRIIHRYLGYFLAGIMTVYAMSGMTLIFRDSNFLKKEKQVIKQLEPGLPPGVLGPHLGIRNFHVKQEIDGIVSFETGDYNTVTGIAEYSIMVLPSILDKMTRLHKARSQDPLFFLNVFFGMSLLFFVVSAFWMYMPRTSVFRKGLYFTAGGILLALLLFFV